jgi:exonuclease SbcC
MIREIVMENIKGQTSPQALTGRDIIVGPNGSGKTTRHQALGMALLGYVPRQGKTESETFKLSSGEEMTVGLVTDACSVSRSFIRKEKAQRDGTASVNITQEITVSPSQGEKVNRDKETRIQAELGNFPVMLDFSEFLSLSDAKRREFFYGLSPIASAAWTRERVVKHLRQSLLTETLQANNPDQYAIMEEILGQVLAQYYPTLDVQPGLQSMLDWTVAEQKHWNAAKRDAVGAVKKLTDLKNELDETDRNIAEHKRLLEEMQTKLLETEKQLSKDTEKKRQYDSRTAKIAELGGRAEALRKVEISEDTSVQEKAIAELRASIQSVDVAADLAAVGEQITALRSALEEKENLRTRYAEEIAKAQTEAEGFMKTVTAINAQAGICVLSAQIKCDKDFKPYFAHAEAQISAAQGRIGEARAGKDAAERVIADVKRDIAATEAKRSELLNESAKRSQQNEAARREIAHLEAEITATKNARSERDQSVRLLEGEIARLEAEPIDAIAPLETLTELCAGLREQIAGLKEKIAEQEKAKQTLSNLKASMIDSKKAAYYHENLKFLAEVLGPKGIQGELVKEALDPIRVVIQENLRLVGVDREFFFHTEGANGKEVFQFGWRDDDGRELNFDALSTGQQMLLLIAMLTTIIERANPPLKVLAIDNIENLDRGNFARVIAGLNAIAPKVDNIILSGVIEPTDDQVPGWKVWRLESLAAQEVA